MLVGKKADGFYKVANLQAVLAFLSPCPSFLCKRHSQFGGFLPGACERNVEKGFFQVAFSVFLLH